MRIYAISDLHLSSAVNKPMDIFKGWDNHIQRIIEDWESKVEVDDIVLLCGDLSWATDFKDAVDDINLISCLKGTKVIIKGNHDYWWNSITALRENLPSDIYALQNDSLRIGSVVICGTRGWVNLARNTEHDQKIYHREIERLKLSLNNMSKNVRDGDTIIAMSHYPPYSGDFSQSPFTELYQKYNVSKVVYGHLHGNNKTPLIVKVDNIDYILTSCDLVGHKLVEIANID